MAMATLERPAYRSEQISRGDRLALLRRTVELLDQGIEFIPNVAFDIDDDLSDPLVDETLRMGQDSSDTPTDLPPHLRRMCQTELLSHEQETALFREMNYLKFRANTLQTRLNPDRPDAEIIEQIESCVARAQQIRDHIVEANMRLVISIVKKFVTPQQSFDDMLSEGTFTLMQAVEKFDYDLGFRFSTYAYRSIARSAYRAITTARKEESRITRDAEQWAFEQEDDRSSSTMSDQVWSNLRELTASMLKQLDRRERFIIRSRYALGSHRKVRTFQYLADKLGVSKERVRQLEKRAVTKLRTKAADFEPDDLFGAAMV